MVILDTPPPDLGPVANDILFPMFNDPHRTNAEWRTSSRLRLKLINETSDETHAPYTWGFTLYRALSGPGSDERFAAGVERLEAWMRFFAREARYEEPYNKPVDYVDEEGPQPGQWHPSDEVARRLWNEVVERYSGQDQVRAGQDVKEGEEDFLSVGRAFLAWTERNVKLENKGQLYTRNDHCLVLDDQALRTLEALPAEVPEVKRRSEEEARAQTEIARQAWVWLLDRDYTEAWIEWKEHGKLPPMNDNATDEKPCPPWVRIRITFLSLLWFGRPGKLTLQPWYMIAQRDRTKYNEVFWWSQCAMTANDIMRRSRKFIHDHGRKPMLGEI